MTASERYDSLFQFYAEHDRDRASRRLAFVARPVPLDWTLLKRQAIAESGLDPDAVSPVGARGLTQFMAATFNEWLTQEWGPTGPPPARRVAPDDPEDAINAQADMMAWLLKTFMGDERKALASYNFGIGNVGKTIKKFGVSWEAHLPDETLGYLKRILG